jgi:hypothetical protein
MLKDPEYNTVGNKQNQNAIKNKTDKIVLFDDQTIFTNLNGSNS